MYAIIETGGKQYKVSEGDVIKIEKLGVDAETTYNFECVNMIVDGENVKVGAPFVAGAAVSATVLGDGKHKKVIIYKYKSKKTFHKKRGHRQPFTQVRIDKISV